MNPKSEKSKPFIIGKVTCTCRNHLLSWRHLNLNSFLAFLFMAMYKVYFTYIFVSFLLTKKRRFSFKWFYLFCAFNKVFCNVQHILKLLLWYILKMASHPARKLFKEGLHLRVLKLLDLCRKMVSRDSVLTYADLAVTLPHYLQEQWNIYSQGYLPGGIRMARINYILKACKYLYNRKLL